MPDLQQAREALAKADRIRYERSELKKLLAVREIGLDDILERTEVPECIQNMRLVDLIQAGRQFGPTKAKRVMRISRLGESTRVGSLSLRQRKEVVRVMAHHFPRPLYGAAWRDYL